MRVYLMRHGRAASGSDDALRPLTRAGREEAGRVLAECAMRPGLILSSPYVRALQTAEIAKEVLGYRGEIHESRALRPGATPEDAWDAIREFRDAAEVLAVCHLPIVGLLAAHLLGQSRVEIDFVAAMVAAIAVDDPGPYPRGRLEWIRKPE